MFRFYTRVCLRKISRLITEYFSKSRNWKTSFTIRSLKSFWHQSFLFHQLISTWDQHQYFPASARLRLFFKSNFSTFSHVCRGGQRSAAQLTDSGLDAQLTLMICDTGPWSRCWHCSRGDHDHSWSAQVGRCEQWWDWGQHQAGGELRWGE